MVEVVNTQKYKDLQVKRSHWQYGSGGEVKTILLMTYVNEDILANHTCVLEWIRERKPPLNTNYHRSIPLRASDWFRESLDFPLPSGENYNPNAKCHIDLKLWDNAMKDRVSQSVIHATALANVAFPTGTTSSAHSDLGPTSNDQGKSLSNQRYQYSGSVLAFIGFRLEIMVSQDLGEDTWHLY
ncbi:hypothetical protein K440DRAFT_638634 [Wilcoxina mikolae CBS 423.85]|nr:hypothetical protein K440DRAFT_638634 [Wilcoxina mikolae CBS 423.85]